MSKRLNYQEFISDFLELTNEQFLQKYHNYSIPYLNHLVTSTFSPHETYVRNMFLDLPNITWEVLRKQRPHGCMTTVGDFYSWVLTLMQVAKDDEYEIFTQVIGSKLTCCILKHRISLLNQNLHQNV